MPRSLDAAGLRDEIHKVRDLTDRPFGVDILFATVGRPQGDRATAAFTRGVQEQIDVVFEERVPVLASGLGDPGPVVSTAHELGMKVLALVGNSRNAERVAASGVDVVVAQGYDGGGHTGRVGTLALVPKVLDVVDTPVVAAGGIADGRGIAAALALGCIGVWLGTRFVASAEAYAHPAYKERIVEIDEEGTTRTRCFSGKPCRVIKNDTTQAWEAPELIETIQQFPRPVRRDVRMAGDRSVHRGATRGQDRHRRHGRGPIVCSHPRRHLGGRCRAATRRRDRGRTGPLVRTGPHGWLCDGRGADLALPCTGDAVGGNAVVEGGGARAREVGHPGLDLGPIQILEPLRSTPAEAIAPPPIGAHRGIEEAAQLGTGDFGAPDVEPAPAIR